MGEKGNGGHVATGGARAVRQVSDTGLGGANLGSAASGGGGLLGDVVSEAGDHATDLGSAALDERREHGPDSA